MRKLFSSVLFVFLVYTQANSQKAPVKYGDVSLDELKMTTCYLDTTAPAVVLCDYGFFRESDFTFTRTVRIKILKKEGYNWANMEFQSESKSNLRGVTSNLVDGKIVQEKLKNESIYRTRVVDDNYVLRPAMPGIKVGSVVDYEFSFPGIPLEWDFQRKIPVIHSEIILNNSKITFRTNFSGYERLTYSSPTRWVARDMPAFKNEPLMGSEANYITKMRFDLVLYSSTWQRVSELLYKSSEVGMTDVGASFLNEIANHLSKKYKNRERLLRAAYDTIANTIVWNENENLIPNENNLANVYKLKAGNSAEINLILCKLLKKLDFDATPVALSTRDNGMISTYFASIRQLNYIVVHVKNGEKDFVLDATEKYMPLTLLPIRCLNVQGLMVNKNSQGLLGESNKEKWIDITNNKKEKDVTIYDLAVDDDLKMQGNVSFLRYDYSAFNFRKAYSKYNSDDELMENLQKEMPGTICKEVNFENLDSVYSPVTEKIKVEIRNQVTRNENNLYINPAYFACVKENPFKLNTRKFPIEYIIPTEKTEIFNLTVPKGYSIAELPASINLKLLGNSAVFMYQVVMEDNHLRLTSKFAVNKTSYSVEEYNELKEFYNQLIKKQSEPIILKKNEAI